MKYKDKLFNIVDIATGETDTAFDVRSLEFAIGSSQKTAYDLAKNGGRYKNFIITPVPLDSFLKKGLKK